MQTQLRRTAAIAAVIALAAPAAAGAQPAHVRSAAGKVTRTATRPGHRPPALRAYIARTMRNR
jgi:hypothetical protein